ncbi:hypothetical protein CYMTET_3800 [Cymbomonas tetramitiformis]|uniref:DUF676 domain-containing protein n=1 Tax=Cymbomonas tetramitiformis TaxID=36881 RepID=A0AAE0LL53_9CHLO|nr:hypothetical protein CYMTET_3800 [Cymbomonas tetramitiformis]
MLYTRPHHQPVMCFSHILSAKRIPEPSAVGAALGSASRVEPGQSAHPHAFIFVHGFLGNPLDLRLVRDHIFMLNPNILTLLSASNQDRTYDDLAEQGHRLACEVVEQLEVWFGEESPHNRHLDKLSFVGHSIGNLIIRSCLADPVMEPYLKYLNTFLSISGPHLGYLYSTNTLFDSGIWFLKSFKRSQCLYQLTFTDASKMHDCYLYKLCASKCFELFDNVILVASPQDGYVPLHSSRITKCPAASKDGKRGLAFNQMLTNLMGPAARGMTRVVRADVHFPYSKVPKSFNSVVGRAAHLEFLEVDIYMRFLLWTYRKFFL